MKKSFAETDLPNAFDNEPEIKESSSDILGDYVTRSFNIASGADVVVSETKAEGELLQVFIFADSSKMDADSLNVLGGYMAIIIEGFEPDSATLLEVDKKLDIGNSKPEVDTIKIAIGTQADFSYSVNKGIIMLSIAPR